MLHIEAHVARRHVPEDDKLEGDFRDNLEYRVIRIVFRGVALAVVRSAANFRNILVVPIMNSGIICGVVPEFVQKGRSKRRKFMVRKLNHRISRVNL